MRNLLLLSFLIAGAASIAAQAPATPAKPAGAATAPTPRTTTAARGAAATAAVPRSGIALVVTDMTGRALPGVTVEVIGLSDRRDQTNANGQVNFTGMQVGTYRLRFSGDTVTAYEREATVAAGKTTSLDVSLSPAPPPKEIIREIAAATPPPPAAPVVGPAGMPQTISLYDTVEKELKQKQPEDMVVSCSGNLRSTLVFLVGKDQPRRLYDAAEASFYVLGGDAIFRIGEKETTLGAGGYVAVPRGVPFSITRRGNKSVEMLALLSGAPCEEAK
jgi:mannose-6-phosphate isomerase-like protein (cupin superfamily)